MSPLPSQAAPGGLSDDDEEGENSGRDGAANDGRIGEDEKEVERNISRSLAGDKKGSRGEAGADESKGEAEAEEVSRGSAEEDDEFEGEDDDSLASDSLSSLR
jgi:hypothetical protein